MTRKNNRTVSHRPDGKWANKKNGNERATSLHDTQKEARETANEDCRKNSGDVTTQGKDGKFKYKDTFPRGDDPVDTKG